MDVKTQESEASQSDKEFVPPSDGSWIPRERGNEMARSARLEAENKALKERAETPEPKKVYNRAELQEMVDAEKLSQAQAETIIDDQLVARAREGISDQFAEREQGNFVSSQLDAYKKVSPEIMDGESDIRKRVRAEYDFLVSVGDSESPVTELKAVRAVLGPVEKLVRTEGSRETFQESGGSGSNDEAPETDGPPKGLTKRERDYYKGQIDKGYFPDWKAVGKLITDHADPALRKRMGAR